MPLKNEHCKVNIRRKAYSVNNHLLSFIIRLLSFVNELLTKFV
jgi:hypothetical protein